MKDVRLSIVSSEKQHQFKNLFGCYTKILRLTQGFLRCFRDPIRVPRIENRVLRIRENRIPRIREIGSLQVHTGYLTFSLKKTWLNQKICCANMSSAPQTSGLLRLYIHAMPNVSLIRRNAVLTDRNVEKVFMIRNACTFWCVQAKQRNFRKPMLLFDQLQPLHFRSFLALTASQRVEKIYSILFFDNCQRRYWIVPMVIVFF